jgi:gamma-glutamyl hydrolase
MNCHILLTLLFFIWLPDLEAKEVPVIGILSKPVYSSMGNLTNAGEDKIFLENSDETGERLIDGAYVNFLEAGGAKVAYIDYRASNKELTELFKKLDGMLIPGGTASFFESKGYSKFARSGKLLLELAIKENDEGGYFPVWGTCLGFELILQLIGENNVLSSNCDCNNYGTTLEFTDKAKFSHLFAHYSPEELYELTTKPYTFNNHQIYISLKTFHNNAKLNSFFNVLATSKDKKGKMTYIAAIEAKKYPMYAVQFHPEKNAYRFYPLMGMDHSREGIRIMQQMSTFFVEECRKSKHKFKDTEEEAKHVVYKGKLVIDPLLEHNYYFS